MPVDEAALRRVEDRLALRELVDRYACIADDRDYALVDQVFSEDGVLVGPGFELAGRDAIRAGMQGIEQYEATLHCVHNQLVEIDGDDATGETWCVASHLFSAEGQRQKLDWGIRYRDAYRRTAAGWRITRRELRLVWEQEAPLRS